MAEEVLERVVRAAVGGAIDAVLRFHYESHRSSDGDFVPSPLEAPGDPPEEIAFPSVTAAEETLFGETPPPTLDQMAFSGDFPPGDLNLDAALAAQARARAYAEQNLQPQNQGGPGEKDVAEWLRLPQQ